MFSCLKIIYISFVIFPNNILLLKGEFVNDTICQLTESLVFCLYKEYQFFVMLHNLDLTVCFFEIPANC